LSVTLIGIFCLTYGNFLWVRATISDETTELRSISDRFFFIRIAIQLIRDHPLVGTGIGTFPSESNDVINAGPYAGWIAGQNVHNMPLLVLSELGVVGFGLWLLILVQAFRAAWYSIHDPFTIGLFAAVIAMLVISLLDHYFWSIFHTTLLLWASLGLSLQPKSFGKN
jgi:O-antigen ligase